MAHNFKGVQAIISKEEALLLWDIPVDGETLTWDLGEIFYAGIRFFYGVDYISIPSEVYFNRLPWYKKLFRRIIK